tara:strand:- start:42 stop:1262 length:1221 start_codon:yes stop_codon:yes gene_type:complete
MIYKLLGWSFLIVFIVYRLDIEKKREPYRNKELKDHGVGTFAVFNTQTIKNDENEDDEDYSHLDKQKILEYVNNLKIDRENKFNEYIALQQSGNISNYTKQLENEIEIVDLNIAKFDRIYYKISISEHNTKENIIPKYNKENDETLFKFPMGNLLPVSDNRNLFENRIQSFDTDIKMINKNTVAYELDNEIFTNEFKNMINKDKKNYYDELIDFEKIYDDDDEDKEKVDETNEEQKGQLRKKEYENVSKKDIDLFNKIEKRVLKDINNNSEFTIGQRSDKFIVVQKKMNYILYNVKNTRELVYDGDIVIYRNLKNHGKHIGFKVLIQNNNIYIIDLKIKGIVTEDKIHMYISSNEFENNLVYYEYDDKYVMTINPREDEVNNMSYMDKIRIMRNRKNALRLDRGLR